jgi:hypothetical protein
LPRVSRWLLLSLPMLLVWWLYGSAVTLPFYTDDANHYRFFQTVENGLALWTGQTWSPYYRPFVYSIWWALIQLQGGFDPVAHHFLNLPIYGLCGVLLSLLLLRLRGDRSSLSVWSASAAGCAFVTFPFHYQAVFQVGSLFHIVMTAGVLTALLLALRFLQTGSRWALVGVGAAVVAAVFSHETGFVVAPLLVGLALIHGRGRFAARTVWVCAPTFAAAAVYVLLWLLLPRVGTEAGLRLSQSPLENAAMLLQPFFYPTAALVRLVVEGRGSALLLIGLFAVWTTLGLTAALRVNVRGKVIMAWGLLWYLCSIALPTLMLQPDYVWSSPRLTMLASVGAVLFVWPLGHYLVTRRKRRWRWVAAACFGVLLMFNVNFLVQRQSEYRLMRDCAWSLVRVMQEADAPVEGALLVNPPDYIEAWPDQRSFLAQAQFASFMSPEVDYRDYLEVNSGGLRYSEPITAVGVGRIMMHRQHLFVTPLPLIDGDTLYEQLRVERPIVVTQHYNGRFFPVWVGRYGARMPEERIAQFADGAISLTGWQPLRLRDDRLQIALQWRVDVPIPAKIFVHVLQNDRLIAQGDGYPWADLYPFSVWRPGEVQVDRREVPLPAGTNLDQVEVLVGLYNERMGERYALQVLASGWRGEQNALRLPR